jgi:leader peptidase (prepilin peptidase)/N-methyltransferase
MNLPLTETLATELVFDALGQSLVVACLVVVGAALGSFLNVVVYRMPRGMSLNRPASRCPNCGHAIRWYDNVPVVGWLMLGGKCRDCRTLIAARYPLVEALVALVAGLLAWQATTVVFVASTEQTATLYQIDLIAWTYRMLLACTLVASGLIEYDGQQPVRRLVAFPLVVGLVMVAIWPGLVSSQLLAEGQGLVAAALGALVALVLGVAAWPAWRTPSAPNAIKGASMALGQLLLVGTLLGDEAVTTLAMLAMTLFALVRIAGGTCCAQFGWTASLASVTLVWVALQSWLPLWAWPEPALVRVFIAGLVILVLANLVRWFPGARRAVTSA